MFLARKITRSKWDVSAGFSKGEIPADAVTGDLRTTDNSLSFWQCGDGDPTALDEAALAIAAGCERVDKLELVWFPDDQLRKDGQQLELTSGRTPVAELARRHVDATSLDYVRLGNIARHVADAIDLDRYRRLSKRRVTSLLVAAVHRGTLDVEALHPKVQDAVGRSLSVDDRH